MDCRGDSSGLGTEQGGVFGWRLGEAPLWHQTLSHSWKVRPDRVGVLVFVTRGYEKGLDRRRGEKNHSAAIKNKRHINLMPMNQRGKFFC